MAPVTRPGQRGGRRGRYLALALAFGLGSCTDGPPWSQRVAPNVLFAGCAAVEAGPVCVLPEDRTLRLWLEAGDEWRVSFAGGAVRTQTCRREECRLVLAVDRGASELRVHLRRWRRHGTWRLRLADSASQTPAAAEARAARGRAGAARRAGRTREAVAHFRDALRLDRLAGLVSNEIANAAALANTLLHFERSFHEAREVLEERLDLLPQDPERAADVIDHLGRIAQEVGDYRAALVRSTEAELLADRLGMADLSRDVRHMRAQALLGLARGADACALIEEVARETPPGSDPCARADVLSTLGGIGVRVRDIAWQGAPLACGIEPRGALHEARELLAEKCPKRVDLAHVLADLALVALRDGDTGEARRLIGTSREAVSEGPPSLGLAWLEIEARIALAEHRAAEALERYAELEATGRRALSPGVVLEALVGQAQALASQGAEAAAMRRLEEGQRLVRGTLLKIPLDVGPGTFLARYERATGLYVALLIKAGELPAAMTTIRHARGQAIALLRQSVRRDSLPPQLRRELERAITAYRQERDAAEAAAPWPAAPEVLEGPGASGPPGPRGGGAARHLDRIYELLGESNLAAGGLRAPADGELLFACYPISREWACLAQDREGVAAHTVGALSVGAPAEANGRQLLGPFAGKIRRARLLRVLAYGALRDVDLHALPFDGAPLFKRLPVVYSLDLPGGDGPSRGGRARTALVAADPGLNLVHARREATEVAARLEALGWTVETLLGPTMRGRFRGREPAASSGGPDPRRPAAPASGPEVRRRMARARLLHYAGHGPRDELTGPTGALPLADGTLLTAGDVVALADVPELVVLTGCDTGRSPRTAPVEWLGIGQAFLVAGSQAVFGADRPVADVLAAEMGTLLYGHGLAAPEPDLPEIMRRAQEALRQRHPDQDWAAFRLLVP